MALKFLGKLKPDKSDAGDVEYIEVNEAEDSKGPLKIRVATLNDFASTEVVQTYLRAGDIVWVKIKPLKEKDMTELKRAVDRLRKTVMAINGDIAGVDEDYLVATPAGVVIHREV